MFFRPNTNDEIIWNNINSPDHNEYRLGDDMTGWTVIDIGAHIGSFVNACSLRGARRILAFEPFPENFAVLIRNAGEEKWDEGRELRLFDRAVWGQTHKEVMTISDFNHTSEPPNTGAPSFIFGNVYFLPVRCIQFDDVISRYNEDRRVDLLKLDCEGSEWPILFTSKRLHLIERIIGEYHECVFPTGIGGKTRFVVDDLVKLLEAEGFDVDHFRHGESHLGMFFAERTVANE